MVEQYKRNEGVSKNEPAEWSDDELISSRAEFT